MLTGLAFGKSLDDRSPELEGLPAGELGPLTGLFPSVAREGFVVERALAIRLGADERASALVLRRPEPRAERRLGPRPAWLGLASCAEGRGHSLLAPPIELNDTSDVLVWDTERVTLPGGKIATLVTLAMGGVALEFRASAFLLGEGDAVFPVRDPKRARAGALAVFGEVAQQFLIPGGDERYARVDRAQGTGFYPLGARSMFLALRVEQGLLRGVLQGGIAADGVGKIDPGMEAWAVVGRGALPSFCARGGEVRCAAIAMPGSGDRFQVDWLAGLWPSADAASSALRALGANPKQLDYLIIGTDDSPQPHGPNGKPPHTFLRAAPSRRAR